MFLLHVLQKFGFGENFVKWIKNLLKNQESRAIKSHYLKLKAGTGQEDPMPLYLLILILQVVFVMIKSSKTINVQKIFKYEF